MKDPAALALGAFFGLLVYALVYMVVVVST